ncbi:hypothetical protein LLY41_02695 [Cytobacillus firmus]|uniref:hypothetical protein n=1 Tax=Cytobacillus firmus TaxID=1399 RepID=UPI00218775BF|nr:hypothetical protein [Cytobacillus firmus]URM33410.1 hypothetical protein LLY41_02695 [Cytobacillus firmus]
MRKHLLLLLTLIAVIILGSACSKEESKAKENFNEQLKVVENFIEIAYFDEGTYEDFTALYADKDKVNSKKEFTNFREKNEPKDIFPKDYENVKEVTKHLVAKKVDKTNVNVYWLENPDKDKTESAKTVWSLTKKDDKWLLN